MDMAPRAHSWTARARAGKRIPATAQPAPRAPAHTHTPTDSPRITHGCPGEFRADPIRTRLANAPHAPRKHTYPRPVRAPCTRALAAGFLCIAQEARGDFSKDSLCASLPCAPYPRTCATPIASSQPFHVATHSVGLGPVAILLPVDLRFILRISSLALVAAIGKVGQHQHTQNNSCFHRSKWLGRSANNRSPRHEPAGVANSLG